MNKIKNTSILFLTSLLLICLTTTLSFVYWKSIVIPNSEKDNIKIQVGGIPADTEVVLVKSQIGSILPSSTSIADVKFLEDRDYELLPNSRIENSDFQTSCAVYAYTFEWRLSNPNDSSNNYESKQLFLKDISLERYTIGRLSRGVIDEHFDISVLDYFPLEKTSINLFDFNNKFIIFIKVNFKMFPKTLVIYNEISGKSIYFDIVINKENIVD